ncbi:MAG: S8 family serine peptidase [Actinophytocola sp.]|nr:S8 family serine peptidase [Actinophytocola sp.]
MALVSLVTGALAGPSAAAVQAPKWESGLRSYFVLTAPGDVSPAVRAVRANGGSVFAAYPAIGVVVAHATGADFAGGVRQAEGVQQAGATRTSDIPKQAYEPVVPPRPPQDTPMGPERPRWNLTQIGADKSLPVASGSQDVVVGVLDTGVDGQHAELDDAFDESKSASCAYGSLDRRDGVWRDTNSHGTHVAGTIAAAKDGVGTLGVAPGVTIASVRVAEEPSGLFFPENAVCGFMFAAKQGFDVANSSYYVDPWQFLCPGDPDQAAILEAVRRAKRYAERNGVLNVAAAGNSDYDLANKTTDSSSPNDSDPIANRPLTAGCIDVPAELPGVVTVSATGMETRKASYSNYGDGKIDITAPGGDLSEQDQGVLSTMPGGRYGFKAGTSMAAPHVTGVAALLASAHPELSPAELRRLLYAQARDLRCPEDDRCVGNAARNSFYGEGVVNAANAAAAAGQGR